MKKIITLILLFTTYAVSINAQSTTPCCPEFALKFKKDLDCLKTGSCASANGESNFTASMCKYSTNTFIVTPNLPLYTYVWTVTGGTISYPAFPATNPATITWGGGGSGTITVVITSPDGKCKKTIKETVCLRDAPQARFTFTPNNACAGTLINFANTSIGGAAVSWDFGDGTFAGNVNNPTHVYAPVMVTTTYNVTITVYSDTADCVPTTQNPVGTPGRACCGCISTYTLPVTVIAGNPLTIVPKECINQCLCAGDTAEYCAGKICAPYNWTVSGGTIISGAGTSCIKIRWTGPYPTSIQLVQPGCGNPCNDTSRLNVPVLVSGIPIMPNVSPVCQFTTQTYYLPAMPGAFYNWSVTGGMIVGPNQNTSSITVMWGPGPTGQVNCTYNNPLKKGCDGTTNLPVNIKPVLKINGPNQTCEGCTITLFTGGATPVSWTATGGAVCTPAVGTATSISFPVTGVMSTYTVTATSGAFCNSPQTTTIVVAPKPVLSITPLTIQTCPGTPVKFVATSTVATTPISWVLPAGASMVANTGPQMDTAVIQFSTIPATVIAEQYCAFNLNCSKGTASATVTLPPVPVITPSVSNPCIDETVNYVVSNPVPGVVYTWAISSTLGTITSGQGTTSVYILWHGGTSNTANLTVSNCAGTSAIVPVTVTLPNFPAISVSGTCIKTGMTLTSTTSGPWLWTGPGIVSGQGTNSININQPGSYCVTINSGSPGSCAQQKCIAILPNPYWVKIIPPCSVESCNPATLSVLLTVSTNIGAPTGCQWMFDAAGGPVVYVPVSTSCGNYTATALGSYYLIMTDTNGCKDTSNIIRIPQDVNICCTTAACSALNGINFNFTHTGCAPTTFTGTPLTLPPGWTTGTLHPTICYGDGTSEDFISLNTIHQYPKANLYTACVVQKVVRPATNDTCCISTCQNVDIPVVASFIASYNCFTGKLTMTDASSLYLAGTTTYAWSVSGGTYTGALTNTPSVVITPTTSGTFVINLIVTHRGCASTAASVSVLVVMPNCNITATPNPSCDGAPVSFSTTPGLVSHNWQFGDGKFSYAATTQHTYAGPGTYNVVLTASTPDGCPVTCSLKVVIQPKPIVTLKPKNISVCPNTPVTITATMNLNGNTMCSNYNLQWYNNGTPYGAAVPVSSFPVNLTVNNYGNFYAVLTGSNPGCNCVITTDTILIKWFAKPVAKIKGKSAVCLVGGSGTLNVENTVSSYPTYNWSSSNPGSISFSPANVYNPTVTITAAGGPFQIFLEVIDINGCKAYDTLCIYANNSPTAFIPPPGGTLCAGNTYALTATPSPLTAPPAGYAYLWNNTAITNTINATAAGVYYAFVTDLNTGCSAATNSIVINKGPDVSLFPSCCDTICDNAPINISVPLPLGPGENICTKYGIIWLDNNVPISPQPSPCNILNTANLVPLLGMHNLSIVVTLNGCKYTSNVFNLYIKHCGDCDCKGSSWGETQIEEGDHPKEKAGPMAGISAAQVSTTKANTGQAGKPIIIKCNSSQKLDCKKTYTVSSSYNCKDTACTGKVTFSLQPPTGPVITGTGTITFTTNVSGTYVLTMYGWCGDKKCDSCVIKFEVNCIECNCKGSKWGERTVTINNNTKTFNCGSGYEVKCKTPVMVNANYLCADAKCNGSVTYSLQEPGGGIATGTLPLTFTPAQTGTYTLTIYGYCGTTVCDSCVIKFTTDCPPPPCCPYEIKAEAGTIKYDYTQIPNATVGSQAFTINGLATANITEVRANVISYDITDNFGKECMKCVTLPFTWSSVSSATPIGGMPGLITMFGGTGIPSFNGSGAGAYQNPREVIWNNGTQINIPAGTNIGMNFILPPVPAIDCCELKGKVCVKFTFRNNECKECEVIICFEFMIKKK